MSKKLELFKNELFGNVRIYTMSGEPWFVAKDICDILGIKNNRDALKSLDTDEKDAVGITDTIGRSQKTSIVNESGLYALIFKSRKKEAKAFRKWVTSEVLPCIRKTGKYKIKSSLKLESTKTRNMLTEKWMDHGCNKPYHYINLTKEEYKTLFNDRNKKKNQMTEEEIIKLRAFEALESFKMLGSSAKDYYECKESIHDTCKLLENI